MLFWFKDKSTVHALGDFRRVLSFITINEPLQ